MASEESNNKKRMRKQLAAQWDYWISTYKKRNNIGENETVFKSDVLKWLYDYFDV